MPVLLSGEPSACVLFFDYYSKSAHSLDEWFVQSGLLVMFYKRCAYCVT